MNTLRAVGASLALSGTAALAASYSDSGAYDWRTLLASVMVYLGCRLAFAGFDR